MTSGTRLTAFDYQMVGASRQIKWVGSTLPTTSSMLTGWMCEKCKRVWMSRYNSLQQGRGCPHCFIATKQPNRTHKLPADPFAFDVVFDDVDTDD